MGRNPASEDAKCELNDGDARSNIKKARLNIGYWIVSDLYCFFVSVPEDAVEGSERQERIKCFLPFHVNHLTANSCQREGLDSTFTGPSYYLHIWPCTRKTSCFFNDLWVGLNYNVVAWIVSLDRGVDNSHAESNIQYIDASTTTNECCMGFLSAYQVELVVLLCGNVLCVA